MHFPGWIPLLIVLGLAFLLFGKPGRLSSIMEDFGKGISGFKKGMDDGRAQASESATSETPRQLPNGTPPQDNAGARTDDRTGA
ncbi:MAG: twin-arginine translocase TatA/TatE family subunit [Alphaproteobacteria bacterium]|jgi:sec-independent protein translocase protein TatA|nr:twin-arginine translocase TatA/TatE family subunit [Alphaproteobacteria bacterium]